MNQNGQKRSGYDAFEQIAKECVFFFNHSIFLNIPDYLEEDTLRHICIPKKIEPHNQKFIDGIDRGVQSIYIPYNAKKNGEKSWRAPVTSEQCYNSIVYKTIVYYFKNEMYEPLVKSLWYAGNNIYSFYRNQIGIYFRNDYYLLNMIGGFVNKNNFAAIYRAQLSKDELIVLFFNAFSSQATAITRKQYLKYDLFNNLRLSDVNLSDRGNINREVLSKLYQAYETYRASTSNKTK